MAIDEALLGSAATVGKAVLRLYRWSPPCISFGRNEPAVRRYDRSEIERRGWDVVRRPTGGRAVWHEDEVTYAVAAPISAFGSLQASYCAIHERLASALRMLGVPAELAPKNGRPAELGAGACFASPVGGEVTARGRKVVGSAQVRLGSAFLQHGSILLRVTGEHRRRQPSAVGRQHSDDVVRGARTIRHVRRSGQRHRGNVVSNPHPYRRLPSSTVCCLFRPRLDLAPLDPQLNLSGQ